MSSNFQFVQQMVTLNGSNVQTFTNPNAKNGIIVADLLASSGGPTSTPQGATTDVTDTNGNQYYAVQQGPFSQANLYVATNIKAGPNTVTYNSTGCNIFSIREYSSILNFFVCPGGSSGSSGILDNINTGYRQLGGTHTFTSSSEVMVVWCSGALVGSTITATTGIIRFQGIEVGSPNNNGGFGDDDVLSMLSYSNQILYGGVGFGQRECIFLNLNKTSCAFSVPGTGSGGGGGYPGAGALVGNIFV